MVSVHKNLCLLSPNLIKQHTFQSIFVLFIKFHVVLDNQINPVLRVIALTMSSSKCLPRVLKWQVVNANSSCFQLNWLITLTRALQHLCLSEDR